ncbi:AAA family ATPase [Methylovirgula sp. 4M-Z18]|uniref:AAA family ATPase n=1 Tax=Methylovirgula sp. 4M-Z18 TaxID=2293567 RepID=UPI000E2F8A9A|nr:AAA family ATPase [Methylovirgula sp. 4M-Z18]RFB81416.1 AAA family ATPase [Methylovirgula sp. 4M-Z18]
MNSVLDRHPTLSLLIVMTGASLLTAAIMALVTGGVGALAHLITSDNLPRLMAALAIILIGALITYSLQRLARVSAHVTPTSKGAQIEPEQLRLLKIEFLPPDIQQGRSTQEALDDLDRMIGLMPVKAEINTLIARLQLEQRRRQEGMRVTAVTQHMIFYGPPGVGKTEVARALGDIFRGLGVLRKGHLVEAQRSDLVGQYIGHTAQKTLDLCQRSLDGILFIDEAYSLYVQEAANDFGREAIDTLLKFMEDNRERLIVIVAGYKAKMISFLQANDGLASRFSKSIDFPPYSSEELCKIMASMANGQGFHLPSGYEEKIIPWIETHRSGERWGNARSVRNAFEKMREAQAVRLMDNPASGHIDNIALEDVEAAITLMEKSSLV